MRRIICFFQSTFPPGSFLEQGDWCWPLPTSPFMYTNCMSVRKSVPKGLFSFPKNLQFGWKGKRSLVTIGMVSQPVQKSSINCVVTYTWYENSEWRKSLWTWIRGGWERSWSLKNQSRLGQWTKEWMASPQAGLRDHRRELLIHPVRQFWSPINLDWMHCWFNKIAN